MMARYFKTHDILEKRLSTGEIDKHTARESLLIRFQNFLTDVSVVGLRYVITSSGTFRRAIWLVLIVLGVGFMLFQVTDRVNYFRSRPTSADVIAEYQEKLPFPTITLCNENLFSRKKLQALGQFGQNLTKVLQATSFIGISPISSTDSVNYDGISDAINQNKNNLTYWRDLQDELAGANTAVFFNDLQRNPSYFRTDEGRESTHNYVLTHCYYGAQPCDPGSWQYVRTDLGMCIQFNGEKSSRFYEVHADGAPNGLQLILNVQLEDYVTPVSHGAGMRMLVHTRADFPYMSKLGARVGAGSLVSMQLKHNKFEALPKPYSACNPDSGYNRETCLVKCRRKYTLGQCACLDYHQEEPGFPNCDVKQVYTCLLGAIVHFESTPSVLQACNCPPQCTLEDFGYSLSSQPISAVGVESILTFLMRETSDCVENDTRSECDYDIWFQYIKESYVQLEVFYSSMLSYQTKIVPSYDFLALMCDIGGALGLVLGSTFLTIAEFIDFAFVHVLGDSMHAKFNRHKSRPNFVNGTQVKSRRNAGSQHETQDSSLVEDPWNTLAGSILPRAHLRLPAKPWRRITLPGPPPSSKNWFSDAKVSAHSVNRLFGVRTNSENSFL